MEGYFVTAIGTDSGKTLVSAILVEALGLDYWKPVQAGLPTDTEQVKALVTRDDVMFHPERFLLQTPASPHAAAKVDGVDIRLEDFVLPVGKPMITEGAGGCMVPLNDRGDFVIDLAVTWGMPVILVADLYLGSINHTLLTVELLRQKGCEVKGLVFNGRRNPESEQVILRHSGYRCLLRVAEEKKIDRSVVKCYAEALLENW